ncbi:adenosine deaminase [Aliiglaciecola sp. 2_MG-2023]|uniref:adenosine deaminase family protein n=1 Tax=unclassified Aliiglaciecola TaxID=2593648 RepID=UPI0026E21630|nr:MULTISPECIES: adenosine deaminase [unclassified Aliiglaciecola]MDO6711576.1 adenosine deaminase [Aliiglaciecola sp. 2_MG-2023]MDO6752647.1 adenosine deaminase [Aliiglaciecola sp. 1_MG-2023]
MKLVCLVSIFYMSVVCNTFAATFDKEFEAFKKTASADELYRFLYAMPKGGDLHNHSTGSNRSQWWFDEAIKQQENGYIYYTKVTINNCKAYGSDQFKGSPYLMLFVNIQQFEYQKLDSCEQSEYIRLQDLSPEQKQAWMNSIRLDKPTEGRDEFFETHWARLNSLMFNPYMQANLIVKNMQAFGAEGLSYLETDAGVRGFVHPDGSSFGHEEVYQIYLKRFAQKDAIDTGVTVRLQYALLRFSSQALDGLEWMYKFVSEHPELYVAVDMVGREDNDKGHPLRFLPTLRKLRHQYHGVNLSIHAGETDEPNQHIRDTLLLGATRIGHGFNLIDDADTLLLMRYNQYLIEINLISNLLLEYVDDYSQHPFPEYLRLGVPVALSTDDRGMWDSNMTDEYYTAVTNFNMSWSELVKTGANSLAFSFVDEQTKQQLLDDYYQRITEFEKVFIAKKMAALSQVKPVSYSYACKVFKVCSSSS